MFRLARLGIYAAAIATLVAGCGSSPSSTPERTTSAPTVIPSPDSSGSAPSSTVPSTPVLSYVDNAVGFGENLSTSYGTHRVLTVHDPSSKPILRVPASMHLVRVPIEECVHANHHPVVVTSAGWTLVSRHPAQTVAPSLRLEPAIDGAPPISANGLVGSGKCAIGDLVFVVRNGSIVRSVNFAGRGDESSRWANVGR